MGSGLELKYGGLPTFILLFLMTTCPACAECPTGWEPFSDRCYMILPRRIAFSQYEKACSRLGGTPLEIKSAAENSFVNRFVRASFVKAAWVWLAINDRREEGVWESSSTHKPIIYSNWANGKPDNRFEREYGTEDCAVLTRDGTWNDAFCVGVDNFGVCRTHENPPQTHSEKKYSRGQRPRNL